MIELFATVFDECIEIIDTLEMTVEEAEAVEAVAQQVVMQKEQSDTFEREKFSVGIKSYPYSVKLNSDILSNGLKITGDAIKATGISSLSDSALSMANTLSSAFGNLTDISGLITGVQGITPTLSAQANIPSGLSEALNVQKLQRL